MVLEGGLPSMLLQSILSQYVTDDVPEGPWIRFGIRGQKHIFTIRTTWPKLMKL